MTSGRAIGLQLRRAGERWQRLPIATRLLAGAALALFAALLGPRVQLPSDTWNHVVVIDITQSMNTRDMALQGEPVPRLAFAKSALRDALAGMPCGSKLGIGVFSEYRVLLLLAPVEVCDNYNDLPAVIDRIDGTMSWAGASEVGKGVGSAVRALRTMAGKPSLIFISDGHEAPPLRPGQRPRFDEPLGEIHGVIAGVGGDAPKPIPKFDVEGHLLGVWEADDVMQTDTISLGQTQNGAKQSLVEENGQPVQVFEGSGTEHLSSLKEPHLRELADVTGLGYRRLVASGDLSDVLRDPALARRAWVPWDLRAVPAALALVLLCAAFLPAWRGARRIDAERGTRG